MNKKILAVAAVLIIIIAAIGIYAYSSGNGDDSDERETMTVVDFAGNEVTVKTPVERVAITSTNDIDVFMAVLGDNWLDYVVMLPADLSSREPGKYQALLEKYPGIADVAKCPDIFSSGNFPAEAILATNPDLVLVDKVTMEWMGYGASSYKVLTDAGVGVMNIDYYSDPYLEDVAEGNIMPLAQLFGLETRGQEIIDYYNEQIKIVTDAVSTIPEKNLTVYTEIMRTSISNYGTTGLMGFNELILLGMTNISSAQTETFNLERLVAADPDVIYIAISAYYGTAEGTYMGFGADSEELLQELAEQYASRPGWGSLKAVENKEVYLYYPELGFTPSAFLKLQMMAKAMYPDYFEDLDPLANLSGFYDKFMPIDADGLWFYKMT